MSSKRTASSSSDSAVSTPKKKKVKKAAGQQSLDNFFRPSFRSPTTEGLSLRTPRAPKASSSFEKYDKIMAERPMEVDGIDLTIAGQLPDSLGNDRPQSGMSASGAIDVDETQASVSVRSSTSLKPKSAKSGKLEILSTPVRVTSLSNSSQNFGELAVDPVSFDLQVSGFPPWPPGTSAPYSFLVHALSTLSKTRSRTQILNVLTNCLRTILFYHPQSLLPTLYLLSNCVSPPYSPIELGLGSSVVTKALQQVSGLTPAALSKLYKTLGDPGDVAYTAKSSVRTLIPHPSLTIMGVYDALLKISCFQGQGTVKQKQSIVEKLLLSAKGEESRYLVRTLFLNLRVGASQTTMLSALARAMVLTPPTDIFSSLSASEELLKAVQPIDTRSKKKSSSDIARQKLVQLFTMAESLVKRCFVQHPNLDDITAALLKFGLEDLAEHVPLAVGIPLRPTLGSPTRSLDEVYDRLQGLPFAAEFKYDGQRAQVHGLKDAGNLTVKIFSRHLEDMTDKYPDIVSLAKSCFASDSNLSSFIMDAEIVAIESHTGELRSFQDLSQRARKDVRIEDVKIGVCLFAFDIMYFNGQVLLGSPFRQRRDILRKHFPPLEHGEANVARFSHVESCESEDGRAAVEEFWQKAVKERSEGLMVKLLDSEAGPEAEFPSKTEKTRRKPLPATYEPDKRTSAWLKLKKDYVSGLGDSLDLVPIGGWHGMGRKANWWSPVLLALRDPANGEFVAVSKCMTGFTDAFYKRMKERYPEDSETCSKVPQWNCRLGGFKPSVFFKPQEVWEIRGADITMSPVSVAAIDMVGTRGLSLRFPRYIKLREDKGLEEASTPELLVNMWRTQESRGKVNGEGVDAGELMDAEWHSECGQDEDDVSS